MCPLIHRTAAAARLSTKTATACTQRYEMNDTRNDLAALRALRRATRDCIVVLEAGRSALTNEVIEGTPEMAYIRSMLAVTTGRRGNGGFGTPIGIEPMLSRALGETSEEEPTT